MKYYKWYDKFLGREVKDNICPHLGTKMVEQDGVLVCPLHNLKACQTSKIIIK
ncbi:Rieske 2Fe-2S domain-containing protein [Arcicella rosea]|uniref:Rieske 2Fe-2S domain-containing protein n=1 Tax=Arcicella rosea TaxID=502909 RepID=UPI0038D4CBBE